MESLKGPFFLLWIIFYNQYILPLPALAPLLGLWWPLRPGDLCLQSPENIRNQTQDKPNANRGLPIKLVNHIQLQLRKLHWKSSWTPTSQNADGAPPYWGFECHVLTHSAAQIQSPGCQMRPMNHMGDPECRHGWSGGRLANFYCLYFYKLCTDTIAHKMHDSDWLVQKDLTPLLTHWSYVFLH